jgi:4-amino-4-deoxy-L-arabinose transferase-like glycosyltransferase
MNERAVDRHPTPALGSEPGAGWPMGRWGWTAALLIAVLALLENLAGNSRTGLWDRDEPRYAVAVREMRSRGDWVFPTFNEEPRYHKPILIYWLMGLTTAIAGDSPFGARLVSGVAGSASCVLIWALGRRMWGPRVGFLAGLMLAVSPIMVAESKLATTDASLTLWLVGCQFCLRELALRPSRALAATFWLCLSLACLTKGPIGPVFLTAAMALAWWWGWPAVRVWKRLSPRWGLLGLVVTTLPWFLTIAIVSRGEFLRFALGTQLVHRLTSGMEHHGGFPGYYLSLSALAFYPWSVLVPAAIWGAWARRRTNPDFGFLLGWVIAPWFFLECLPTRLLHYFLPAYPACALLTAWMLEAVAGEDVTLRRWPLGRLGLGLLGGIGIAGTVVLLAAAVTLPVPLRLPLAFLAVILGAGTLTAMLWLHRGLTRKAGIGLGLTWAVFVLLVGGWLIPAAEPYRTSRRIGERLKALSARTGIEPVLLNYQEPGVIYAMEKPVATVRDRAGFYDLLDRKSSLLTVITPEEAPVLRERYRLNVNIIDAVEGFSLTKGRNYALQFAVLRRTATFLSREESTARAGYVEQSLIK